MNIFVPAEIRSFSSLFQYMMEIAGQRAFNLVIDEFQEFYNINNSIYSDIQNIWDRYRKETKMNLIVCGSIYSLMNKIFQNNKEPLFGRADIIIKLSPFSLPVLKEIMYDYYPTYTNDDLLALYTFTGGIPKYVELFCDNRILNINGMIDFMVRDNSRLQMKERIFNRRIRQKLCDLFFYFKCHSKWQKHTGRNRSGFRE